MRPHWFPRCLRSKSQSYVPADPGDIPPATSISGVGLFWFTPAPVPPPLEPVTSATEMGIAVFKTH